MTIDEILDSRPSDFLGVDPRAFYAVQLERLKEAGWHE